MAKSTTLIGLFLDTVAAHPKPDLFMRRTPVGWENLSAERARSDVECLALAFEGLGVRSGDRVAILSENRYEWPIVDLAVLGLGAVSVPIYPTLTPAQCRLILANSEAKVAVVSSATQLAKIREVAATLPALETIVQIDPGPLAGAKEHALDVLLARGAELERSDPGRFEKRARSVKAEDLATIIYTSGTTGDPKGAMLLHRNITSNVWACLEVVSIAPSDRCLSFLPLCHIFERMAGLYAMLATGASIAYAQSIETVAADAVEVRPTLLCGVPRFYEKVYARVMDKVARDPTLRRRIFHWGLGQGLTKARAHFEGRELDTLAMRLADRLVGHKVRERVGGRLRYCISGGAPLAPKVMEFFFAVGIPVIEGYGLTETSPVICLNPPGHERPGSVGKPVPGVEVRIARDGEILTRGPHVMLGYFNNPAATDAAIQDGWFHTGDVGNLDDEGYLRITDRLKDIIVTAGGKKVAPQPIEARLKTSKWVSEAVLLGDGKPFVVCLLVPNQANLELEATARGWSHRDLADLLARPEVRAIYQAEIDRVNADLAKFESIKRFELIDRELSQEAGELTPTLKVKRRVVLSRFAEIVDRLYAGHQMPGAA